MKKSLVVLILVLALTSLSASAFASPSSWAVDSIDLGGSLTLKASKNVLLSTDVYVSSNRGIAYTIGAYHSAGNRTFASSSGDQSLFYVDTTGQTIPNSPQVGGASADFTAWKSL
jgi:hypothetical protein